MLLRQSQEGLTGKAGVRTRLECYIVIYINGSRLNISRAGAGVRVALDHVMAVAPHRMATASSFFLHRVS